MRLHEAMRSLEGVEDQLDRWKILEMSWMNMDYGTLALWGENLHGVMDTRMVLQFRRG